MGGMGLSLLRLELVDAKILIEFTRTWIGLGEALQQQVQRRLYDRSGSCDRIAMERAHSRLARYGVTEINFATRVLTPGEVYCPVDTGLGLSDVNAILLIRFVETWLRLRHASQEAVLAVLAGEVLGAEGLADLAYAYAELRIYRVKDLDQRIIAVLFPLRAQVVESQEGVIPTL